MKKGFLAPQAKQDREARMSLVVSTKGLEAGALETPEQKRATATGLDL